MQFKEKILLCVMPYGAAVAVAMSLAQPAYDQYVQRASNVEDKKKEQQELDSKLKDTGKLAAEKRQLQKDIEGLRGSVPKSPDLPLLTVDLEKMALDSGLELIYVKQPDKETLKKAGLDEEGPPGTNFSQGKARLAGQVRATMAPAMAAGKQMTDAVADAAGANSKGGGKPGKPGEKGKKGPPPDGGLLKALLNVKVFGSYKSLRTFVHKLETYQRVVAISDLKFGLPKGNPQGLYGSVNIKRLQLPDDTEYSENDLVQGDPNRMNISMTLTTYYLP